MNQFLKLLAIIAGAMTIARIAQANKVCLCAGPICACGYKR